MLYQRMRCGLSVTDLLNIDESPMNCLTPNRVDEVPIHGRFQPFVYLHNAEQSAVGVQET